MSDDVSQGLRPGRRLGRYEILRQLAVGGMAELYLARACDFDGPYERRVVLKRIRSELANDGDFVRMFYDEARLSATLQHSNIAQVHEVEVNGPERYFVMEYVEGVNLAAVLNEARLMRRLVPLEAQVTICAHVAAALHYAHERRGPDGTLLNVVHRDVSPSNVMISYDGAVKLVDFGIAKAAVRSIATRAGAVKGKLHYLSPEQCRGQPADRRSDLYSLGVVLYEMSTGVRPIESTDPLELLRRVTQGAIKRPSEQAPDYPPELEAVVMRALATTPTDRFATALEMQAALEELAVKRGLALSSRVLAGFVRELLPPQQDTAIVEPWGELKTEPMTASIDPQGPRAEPGAPAPQDATSIEPWGELKTEPMTASVDPKGPRTERGTPPTRRPSTWVAVAAVALAIAASAYAVSSKAARAPEPAAPPPLEVVSPPSVPPRAQAAPTTAESAAAPPVAALNAPETKRATEPEAPPSEPTKDPAGVAEPALRPSGARPRVHRTVAAPATHHVEVAPKAAPVVEESPWPH